MLGNMRGNRASIDIIDELKMCSSEEIATVKKIVDAFVLKRRSHTDKVWLYFF